MTADRTELGRLVAQAADGALDAEEHARLSALLLNDPAAQRFYLEYVALDVELAWSLGTAAPEFTPPATGATLPAGTDSWRRGRRWLLATAAAALAAAACLAFALWPRSESPAGYVTLVEVEGDVAVVAADETTVPATVNLRVPLPVTLRTSGANGSAAFQTDDGTSARLSALGSLTLAESRPGKSSPWAKAWVLNSGILYADVAPQPPAAPLIITTPHAEVTVRGTRFTLSVVKNGYTRIDMAEGEVEFRSLANNTAVATVDAGEYALTLAGTAVVETHPLAELIRLPKREWPNVTADMLGFPETGPLWGISAASLTALDTKSGRAPKVVTKLDGGRALPAIALDRSQVALARPNGVVQLYTTSTGGPSHALPAAEHPIDAVALAPAAQRVAVAENLGGQQCQVKVWSVADKAPQLVATHTVAARSIGQLAWSPDDDALVIVARGGPTLLVDPGQPERRQELSAGAAGVRCAAYSADGRFLALGCEGGNVLILNAAGRSTLQTLATRQTVSVLAFSPDGLWLAGALPTGHVRIWRVVNGQELANIETRGRAATALAYSADSQELAVHVPKRGVLLFDTARVLHVLQAPAGTTPSPSDTKRGNEKQN